MSKVICIYPRDPSTKFLNILVKKLHKLLGEDFYCFVVEPNNNSHLQCIKRLTHGDEQSILFLGHGTSTELFGAYNDTLLQGTTFSEEQETSFIHRENIHVFSGKKVFCLSCNSNDKISKWAVDKGARTFLGFGNICTDWSREDHMAKSVSKTDIYLFRRVITLILAQTFEIVYENDFNFNQLDKVLRIVINKWLKNRYYYFEKQIKSWEWFDEQVYRFKDEIIIHGNNNLFFFNA